MKTKKQLEKGCGEEFEDQLYSGVCGRMEDLKHSNHIILCNECQATLTKTNEIIEMIKGRIKVCYENLLFARSQRGFRKDWEEGFRSRLDELILIYHIIKDISFMEACEELEIPYKDVNVQTKIKGDGE